MMSAQAGAVGHSQALREALVALLNEEHARSGVHPLEGVDQEPYLDKIFAHAELIATYDRGELAGLIAFYCNNPTTRVAYITLVIVASAARGKGVGRELVQQVLARARSRRFSACDLEVRRDNTAASNLYERQGFVPVEQRGYKVLMRCVLA